MTRYERRGMSAKEIAICEAFARELYNDLWIDAGMGMGSSLTERLRHKGRIYAVTVTYTPKKGVQWTATDVTPRPACVGGILVKQEHAGWGYGGQYKPDDGQGAT